ncbi:MAG TPA: regulatory protein RecX [Selenomonadales bacterium]|nr:regulatory protein RecX [Selenomonadales bacterium]
MLAVRDYSEKELRLKLMAKNYPAADVDAAVARLQERGYLDDTALCRRLLEKFAAGAQYGVHGVAERLKRRGIPGRIVAEALAEYDRGSDYARAQALVKRKFKTITAADAAKVARFLGGRGFGGETVRKILAELCHYENF